MSFPSPVGIKATVVTTKKPQSLPWSHHETLQLIQAYKEKWYSLKRGQLKASQWEEVAVTVAARCALADDVAKTAIQCRHKMEKLRRRYRAERQCAADASSWPYYDVMDELDRGPLPISAHPLALIPSRDISYQEYYPNENDSDINDDNVDDVENDNDEGEDEGLSKSRSINYILRRPSFVNRFSGFWQSSVKRQRLDEEEGVEEVVEAEMERGGVELATEIRKFSDRFAGMERMRMKMMRETERCRMEMENKRIKMILDSQRKIVDMIATTIGSPKSCNLGASND